MPSPVLTPSSPAVRRRSGDNALAKSLEGLITDDILDEIAMTGTPKSDADASPSSPSRKAKADPSLWGGGNAAVRVTEIEQALRPDGDAAVGNTL